MSLRQEKICCRRLFSIEVWQKAPRVAPSGWLLPRTLGFRLVTADALGAAVPGKPTVPGTVLVSDRPHWGAAVPGKPMVPGTVLLSDMPHWGATVPGI